MALRVQNYCVENKNVVVVVAFISSKHNSLFGRLGDLNYFYTEINTMHASKRVEHMYVK